jgi:CheY-like chemotaxis protein
MNRLLLIDDDEINNFTIEAMLTRIDFVDQFVIKDGGIPALSYLQEAHKSGEFPNSIFVDINMPEMDGFEFLENFESSFFEAHPDTQVFMLSSSDSDKDKQRAMGFTCVREYITKPLSKKKLSYILGE